MKRIFLLSLFVSLFGTLSSYAQSSNFDYEPFPHGFVSVQGGGQVTFSDCDFTDLVTPIGAVSVGGYFDKAVGARLNVSGWQNKGGFKLANDESVIYKFKYITTNADLMLNLTNLFSKKDYHKFNVVLIGGIGLACPWDVEKRRELAAANNIKNEWLMSKDAGISHNLRAGLQLDYNIAKHWSVNMEVLANNLDDKFNGKYSNSDDWQVSAFVGLTYKFGFKKRRESAGATSLTGGQTYNNSRNSDAAIAGGPKVEDKVKEEKKVEPVVAPVVAKPEKKEINVFFVINSRDISGAEKQKVKEVAEWLKKNPKANINLTGYADAGTGTESINMSISKKRVDNVAKMLVEEFGIDAKRVKTSYKGDTVQPFSENDRNRVVIGISE